jgi:hypothetical protein
MYHYTPDVEMTDADSMKQPITKRSRLEKELNCLENALVVIKRFKRVKFSDEPKEPPAKRVKRFKVSEEEGFKVMDEQVHEDDMEALCAAFAKMVV